MSEQEAWHVAVVEPPPGPRSIDLWERRKKAIGNANYTGLYGVSLARGLGPMVRDEDDNVYLDCLSCASSTILGYGQEFLVRAYHEQAERLQQSCLTYSLNRPAIEFAERLIGYAPGDFDKRVLIGLSGSDASGGAIKAVRKHTKRNRIIHFKNDYHGSTGISQQASNFGDLDDGIYAHSKNFKEYDYPTDGEAARRILRKIRTKLEKGKTGGIICEGIQGDAGINVPPEGFIRGLREVTEETGTVLIIDEVQSGMGRTGKWWSFMHEGIVPDLFVTAKGLSAGFAPISAVVGRTDILDSLAPGQHLLTFGGHPPSCAVASAVLDHVETHDLPGRAARVGGYLLDGLTGLRADFPEVIVDVRGRGLMIGVQIDISSDPLAGKVFATRCMELGAYVGFLGVNADVIRIEPPLTIEEKHADFIVTTIGSVAGEMKAGKIPAWTRCNVEKYSIGIGGR